MARIRRWNRADLKRKGMAIMLTALMLVFVIPIVGLAVDAGVLYVVKTKLSAACDAAALAAARSLSNALTLSAQKAEAEARAQAFFDANWPAGLMATQLRSRTAVVSEPAGSHIRSVKVDGSVDAPVYFMRTLGFGKTIVSATGTAERRDVNVILVLDRSGSLDTANACDDVEVASLAFVNQFSNERDNLGLVSYGGSYRLDVPMTKYFKTGSPNMVSMLSGLYTTSSNNGCNGWTGTAQAMWIGYQQLVALAQPGALNVMLLFTDGVPNTITAQFPVAVTPAPTTNPAPAPSSGTYLAANRSRCWDWGNNKAWNVLGWNPVNQKYFGFIAGDSGSKDGVRSISAGAMPVTGDPGAVTIPVGFSGSAKSSSSDCWYRTTSGNVYRDIHNYPNTDYYGTSLYGYKTVDTYPAGHPYAGKIRTDQGTNMTNAAINAVDNVAARMRNKELDANLDVRVYAIGLGGAGEAEHTLLQRVANDPASPIYDATRPEGLYIYSPTPEELTAAFTRIASEILRFAQ